MFSIRTSLRRVRLPPALRYRDFRLFTLGYFPAETGEYIHFVVQNWLAWELTHSAFYSGLLGFFEFAPRFIFGPIGGVVADRMDRLKLLILSRSRQSDSMPDFRFSGFLRPAGVLAYRRAGDFHGDRQFIQHGGATGRDRHSGAARRSRQRAGAQLGNP